ncbi:MAG: restriction endonuclease subunit S [Promethearchaeota archaeon]
MKNVYTFKKTEIGMIPEDWRLVTIPEIADNFDKIREPLSSKQRSKMKGKYPYYGAAKVIDYINDYKFEGDYLLIAEDGSVTSNGSNPTLQLAHGKFWVSNHAHVLQCKSYEDTLFLYYQLKNTVITPFITGAVQPKLNQKNLNRIKIAWIDSDYERHLITKILSDLDKKIELYHKMNETLEKMTQAIFKSWFIDFEPFLDKEFEESKLGRIPKGWKIKPIGEFADFLRGFSYKGTEKFDAPNDYVFITLNNVFEGGGFKPKYTWLKSERLKERYFIKEGDLIIPNTEQTKDGRLLGFPAIVYFPYNYKKKKGVFSHHITKIIPKNNNLLYYLCLVLKIFQKETTTFHTGTTVWGLDIKGFKMNKLVAAPPDQKLSEFSTLVKPYFNKIISNCKEIMILEELRDLLLPQLMSGRLRIINSQKFLEENSN